MNIKFSKSELTELKRLLNHNNLKKIKDIDHKILNEIAQRIDQNDNIKLYVDGAADLHSKTAGIGGVIYRNGEEVYSFSEHIGSATNNEAEYGALVKGLEELINLNLLSVDIFADSELIVKQINGEYKVKNERMQKLNMEANKLLDKLEYWSISHVLREKNSVADQLSKEGMRKK